MRTMVRALELRVDFWDTANVYGEGVSETLIGGFLAEDRAAGEDHPRDQVRHPAPRRRDVQVRQQPTAYK